MPDSSPHSTRFAEQVRATAEPGSPVDLLVQDYLDLVEQLEKAKAEAEALREHYTTLVHRHYHAKREAEERLNSAVYEYEKDLAAAEAALQKIEKEAELRSERHIAAIAHRALGGREV